MEIDSKPQKEGKEMSASSLEHWRKTRTPEQREAWLRNLRRSMKAVWRKKRRETAGRSVGHRHEATRTNSSSRPDIVVSICAYRGRPLVRTQQKIWLVSPPVSIQEITKAISGLMQQMRVKQSVQSLHPVEFVHF